MSFPTRGNPPYVVKKLPSCYSKEAQICSSDDFKSELIELLSKDALQDIRLKMCKMIVIGDTGVGKTSLIRSFCQNRFDTSYIPTVGVDFAVQRFDILNTSYTLQMWDTAGQERFQSIATTYYRGADVIAIIFDLTDRQSLLSCEAWLYAAKNENWDASKMQIYLIGTKADLLPNEQRFIITKAAMQMAKSMHAEYWQVSSKTCENVRELFSRIAALAFETSVLREVKQKDDINHAQNISLENNRDQRRFSFCC